MKIIWVPNPLHTVIEVDDHDKQLLWHKIKIGELEDKITSAYFDLDPERHAKHETNLDKPTILDEMISSARGNLDIDYVLGDVERNGSKFNDRIDKLLAGYVEALSEPHCGDCTCVPASCIKCRVEGLLGVDTIKGLRKHSAYKVDNAFKRADDASPPVSIDEAIERLRTYHLVYKHNPNWPESEWVKNVPRWLEEAKDAYEWLVAYRTKHFSGT